MHRIKQESCGKKVFLNADLNLTSNVLERQISGREKYRVRSLLEKQMLFLALFSEAF